MTENNWNINRIKSWLEENENHCKYLIHESSCRKWSKWIEDKSTHIYPCVCPSRKQDCIFIETYYRLHKTIEVYERQPYISKVLAEYEEIKDNYDAVYDWVEKYHAIGNFFEVELSTYIKTKSKEYLTILLDAKEFETALKFEALVFDIYCSKEYQFRNELNKN